MRSSGPDEHAQGGDEQEVAFVGELTKETIHLPLGCLQGGVADPMSMPRAVMNRKCFTD